MKSIIINIVQNIIKSVRTLLLIFGMVLLTNILFVQLPTNIQLETVSETEKIIYNDFQYSDIELYRNSFYECLLYTILTVSATMVVGKMIILKEYFPAIKGESKKKAIIVNVIKCVEIFLLSAIGVILFFDISLLIGNMKIERYAEAQKNLLYTILMMSILYVLVRLIWITISRTPMGKTKYLLKDIKLTVYEQPYSGKGIIGGNEITLTDGIFRPKKDQTITFSIPYGATYKVERTYELTAHEKNNIN